MPIVGKWEAQESFLYCPDSGCVRCGELHWWINFEQCEGAALGEMAQAEFSISK